MKDRGAHIAVGLIAVITLYATSATAKVLPVDYLRQGSDDCWAAASAMFLNYYGIEWGENFETPCFEGRDELCLERGEGKCEMYKTFHSNEEGSWRSVCSTQLCAFQSWKTGLDCCNESNRDCAESATEDRTASFVNSILDDYGLEVGDIALLMDDSGIPIVKREIDRGRPLLAFGFIGLGGHVVVIVGYTYDENGDFRLFVNDPQSTTSRTSYIEVAWADYLAHGYALNCQDAVLTEVADTGPEDVTDRCYIEAGGDYTIENGESVTFRANQRIHLTTGFSVAFGGVLDAKVTGF